MDNFNRPLNVAIPTGPRRQVASVRNHSVSSVGSSSSIPSRPVPTSPKASKRKRQFESFYDFNNEKERRYLNGMPQAQAPGPNPLLFYSDGQVPFVDPTAHFNPQLMQMAMLAQMAAYGGVDPQLMSFPPMTYPVGELGLELGNTAAIPPGGWQRPTGPQQPLPSFPHKVRKPKKEKSTSRPNKKPRHRQQNTDAPQNVDDDEDIDGMAIDPDYSADQVPSLTSSTSADTSPSISFTESNSEVEVEELIADPLEVANNSLSLRIQEMKELFARCDVAPTAQEKRSIMGLLKQKDKEVKAAEAVVAAAQAAQPPPPPPQVPEQPQPPVVYQPRRHNQYQHWLPKEDSGSRFLTGVASPPSYVFELSDSDDDDGDVDDFYL